MASPRPSSAKRHTLRLRLTTRPAINSRGGEPFKVDLRGSSLVRARVTDNENGTYTVSYVPTGAHSAHTRTFYFNADAFNDTLSLLRSERRVPHSRLARRLPPGSPFAITVSSSRPDPMRCVLKGDALHRAVAREQASFEIAFHDSIGQYTHAEEVDVYVERLEEEDDGNALEQMSGELEAAENAAAEQLRAQQQQAQGGSPKRRGSNASLIDVSDLSSKASEGGSSKEGGSNHRARQCSVLRAKAVEVLSTKRRSRERASTVGLPTECREKSRSLAQSRLSLESVMN